MYRSTGKPSISKFKVRVARIIECADSAHALADRWNPKGRNFQLQRELLTRMKYISAEARIVEDLLRRR